MNSYLELLPQELLYELCILLKSDAKVFLKLGDYAAGPYKKYLNNIKLGIINEFIGYTLNDINIYHTKHMNYFTNIKFPNSEVSNGKSFINTKLNRLKTLINISEETHLMNINNIDRIYHISGRNYTDDTRINIIYKTVNNINVNIEYNNSIYEPMYIKIKYSKNWKTFWNNKLTNRQKESLLRSNGYIREKNFIDFCVIFAKKILWVLLLYVLFFIPTTSKRSFILFISLMALFGVFSYITYMNNIELKMINQK